MEEPSYRAAGIETRMQPSPRPTEPLKIPSDSKSHRPPCSFLRHHGSSFRRGRHKNAVSRRLYSIPDPKSDKSFESRSNCSRRPIDMSHDRGGHSSNKTVHVIDLVNTYYGTALDYHSYCLVERFQKYYEDIASRAEKMVWRVEVPLKYQMFESSKPTSILGYFHALQTAGDIFAIHEGQQCGYSNSS